MTRQQIITLTILSCFALARGFVGVIPTKLINYSIEVATNDNYLLFWKFNSTHTTFEVHVKTYGYVGLGLSDNGNMYPADVVVGWVKDGVTHFKDYHTIAHASPLVDTNQDWLLLHGEENDFGTVLKFVRKLDTCDKTEDKKIEDGTVRVIYSYHPSEPATNTSLMYHGPEHRGTKSLSLMSVSSSVWLTSSTEHHDVLYDFLNENLPTTTYNCRVFRMPNIGGKHHMIKVEPIITPGNETHVHHMVVNRCRGIDPKFDKVHYMCCEEISKGLQLCYDVIITWAIGGNIFYYPDHVGFSIGAADDPEFYILETHYDNPAQKSGMIDNSGIRITLTKTLRPYEAVMMEFGHHINWRHIIPPFEKTYLSQSHCPSQCIDHDKFYSFLTLPTCIGLFAIYGFSVLVETRKTLGNMMEIKVFGIFQHAHLLGRTIKTRHFRKGSELSPLAKDPHYDFDFQETRLLREEAAVRRGDSFIVECSYDSSETSTATLGGLSTRDEMCLSFLFYYPKVALKQCLSSPTYDSISNDQNRLWPLLSKYNWTTQENRDMFKRKLKESSIFHFCQGDTMVPQTLTYTFHEKLPGHIYIPPTWSVCP